MAIRTDYRRAFTSNRVLIVKNLANPDDVVDSLLASNIFNHGMADAVFVEKEKEKKTRKLLDTLAFRGEKAVRFLHDAFLDTSNEDLAKLLSPYVIIIEGKENLRSPTNWPPDFEEQIKMENDNVIQIKDLKHPSFIHDYTSNEVYKLRKQIRGKAFIINNINFEKSSKLKMRKGSNYDAENLEKLFCELQFEVIVGKDMTAKGITEFLQQERDKVNWYEMECVILVIMSHGEITGVYGTDGAITPLKQLTDIFDSEHCPGLNEKPRLVFVQACRTISEKTPGNGSVGVEKGPGNGSIGVEKAPGNESVCVEEAPGNGSVGVEKAPGNESVRVEEAPGNGYVGVEKAPGNESVRVEEAPGNGPVGVEKAPGNESVRVEEAQGNESVRVEKAPGNGSVDVEEAPGNESVRVEEAPGNEYVCVEEATGNGSVRVEEEMAKLHISASHDVLDAVPSQMMQSLPKTVHSAAHFFIAYATPEGTASYRHPQKGSWFINAVVWSFKYHAHNTNLNDLMTKVNRLVAMGIDDFDADMRTVSECINRLTNTFFFFPGVYDDPPKFAS